MNLNEYNIYAIAQRQALNEKDKAQALKTKVEEFADIDNIEKARKLAYEVFSISGEYSSLFIGDAKFSVINTKSIFRITYDSSDEFICYDFS